MIRFKIQVYTHGVTVKVMFRNDLALMTSFNKRLEVFEKRYIRGKGYRMVLAKTFSVFYPKTTTYGLHRNQLNDLLSHFTNMGVGDPEIEITYNKQHTGVPIELTIAEGVKPKDIQTGPIDFLNNDEPTTVLPLQTGFGKSQPLYSKIQVPDGWSTMGDMQVGTKVVALNGDTTTVTGVYPQPLQDVYTVTFEDGRSTHCCYDHLWNIFVDKSTFMTTISTGEVLSRLRSGQTLSINTVRMKSSPADVPNMYELGQSLGTDVRKLTKLQIWCRKITRHVRIVTERQMLSNFSSRLELLRGILAAQDYKLDMVSNDRRWLVSVQALVRSLGGKSRLISSGNQWKLENYVKHYEHIKDGSDWWCSYTSENLLFSRSRPSDDSGQSDQLKIINIVKLEGRDYTQCISVGHPTRLYVTDDYIVTHNTFMGLYTSKLLGTRTAVIMGAMHIPTWRKDCDWIFQKHEDNYAVIKGKAGLRKAIMQAKEGKLHTRILLMSVNTVRDYLTEFDNTGESTYGCVPRDLFRTLGVGFRITDESHTNLHFMFRLDISTDVPKACYLSATIESNEVFTNQMYDIIFPRDRRYTKIAWNKYIDVLALGYSIDRPELIKYTGGNGMYNHGEFEKSILKSPSMTSNYIDMITRIVRNPFIENRAEGHKLLIFMYSIEFCSLLAKHLQQVFPEVSCSDYTGVHEEEVLHNHDIIVSTLGSTGVGKDIKGLTTTILTVALNNKEKNIQSLGRLRPLDNQFPGVVPKFIYLVATDIDKHNQYHMNKLSLFRKYAKSVNTHRTNFNI